LADDDADVYDITEQAIEEDALMAALNLTALANARSTGVGRRDRKIPTGRAAVAAAAVKSDQPSPATPLVPFLLGAACRA
jgi:hypothetical protein